MSKWPMRQLGDIFEIARGGSPRPIQDFLTDDPDGTNWITISDATDSGKYIEKTARKIKPEGAKRSRRVAAGDFLLTNSMSFGRPYIMKTDGCIHDGWLHLKKRSQNVDDNYFYHLLGSDVVYSKFKQLAAGAIVKNLNIDLVSGVVVPFPDLQEQRRIAGIFDKVDSLRRKRQEAIGLADALLRAAFNERCGDPVANSLLLPERQISEIGTVTTGNTPSRDVDAHFGDAIEWIKSDNINTPGHVLTKAREGLSEFGAKVGRIVPAGSILMTCIAGSPNVIGNVALTDRRVAFNQQINAITPTPGVEPDFLYALLLYSKPRIQAASTKSMKGMVSKGTLEKIRVIWPAADVQREIAILFRKVKLLIRRMDDADPVPLLQALQNELLG